MNYEDIQKFFLRLYTNNVKQILISNKKNIDLLIYLYYLDKLYKIYDLSIKFIENNTDISNITDDYITTENNVFIQLFLGKNKIQEIN